MTGIKAAYVGYDDIVRQFGEEKIQKRYEYFFKKIAAFIERFGYAGRVSVNEIALWYSLFDYFSDISRLKSFHGIEKVNEQFALVMIVHFLQDGKKEFALLKGNDKLNFFMDSVYYFLKYRRCDAQMLELMLLSFEAGGIYNRLLGEQ
jgi:hypothetical protein